MSVFTDSAFVFILMCGFSFANSCNCLTNCLCLAVVSLTLPWVCVYCFFCFFYLQMFVVVVMCSVVFAVDFCLSCCVFVCAVACVICLCITFRYFAFPVCVCCLVLSFLLILFWQNKDTHSPNTHLNSLALNHTRSYHSQIRSDSRRSTTTNSDPRSRAQASFDPCHLPATSRWSPASRSPSAFTWTVKHSSRTHTYYTHSTHTASHCFTLHYITHTHTHSLTH